MKLKIVTLLGLLALATPAFAEETLEQAQSIMLQTTNRYYELAIKKLQEQELASSKYWAAYVAGLKNKGGK